MKEDLGRDTAQNRRAAPHRAHRTGRRRRWAVAATLLVLAGTATAGGLVLDRDPGPAPDPAPGAAPAAQPATTVAVTTTTTTPPPPELPRGGRQLFPRYRVVGFYGMQNLDVLGAGPAEVVAQRLLKVARPYARPGRPVMPMFELIATIAHPFPTPSGLYRTHQEDAIVRSFLKAVRRIDGVLVLDVQPGRDDFLSSLRHWEPYLRQPDVGIALDPEFSMGPGQVPGRHLGRTDAAAINRASAYVAGIVRHQRLPQKLFIIHQFHDSMIRDKARIAIRPGLAMTWNADGFGARSAKLEDYRSYTRDRRFHPGLKLFYENDVDIMSPREVMRLKPPPRVINYQ
ncbi:MAG: hypothetical protein ACJ77H_10155 [Actinomycetota bacterium]